MQTASHFVTHGSSVHAVFLDVSKALDRVLRMKLFEKLIQRKVPIATFTCQVTVRKIETARSDVIVPFGLHCLKVFHVWQTRL